MDSSQSAEVADLQSGQAWRTPALSAHSSGFLDGADAETTGTFIASTIEPMEVVLSTRELFNEGQKIAYAGLVYITTQDGYQHFEAARFKSLHIALQAYGQWAQRIILRLYQHLDISKSERCVIERMPKHGVLPQDLASSIIPNDVMIQHRKEQRELEKANEEATRIAAEAAQRKKEKSSKNPSAHSSMSAELIIDSDIISNVNTLAIPALDDQHRSSPEELPELISRSSFTRDNPDFDSIPDDALSVSYKAELTTVQLPLVKLTKADIRHAVVSDLFLLCIADYNYDARARTLVHAVARHLLLPYDQVVAIEITFATQLQFVEGASAMAADQMHNSDKRARRRRDQKTRYVALAAATVGGGLVLGLSAGLAAPLIGAGLGAAFAGVGLTGTTAFLSGTGGIALITTGATMAGSGIAGSKMANRTRGISEFSFLPLHEMKRTSVIITVGGWLAKTDEENADISVPFSIVDESMGDHYSVLWEPDTLRELGGALKMIAGEVISTAVQQALMVTMLHSLLAALAWPLALTRLGYLIDNPWQNALARSKKAGLLLADLLMKRVQEARPVTLIGYSLGARLIYYCLRELAHNNAFGIVENVYLFGCPVTASEEQWHICRTVVSGRFVNGSVKHDWILGFLFRATSGGFSRVAGLGGCNMAGIEEIDLTEVVNGHLMYRVHMPQILKHCGIRVNSDDLEFLSKKDERIQAAQEERERIGVEIRQSEKAAKKRKNRMDVLQNLQATNGMTKLPIDDKNKSANNSYASLAEAIDPHRRPFIEDLPSDCPVKEIHATLPMLVIDEKTLLSPQVSPQPSIRTPIDHNYAAYTTTSTHELSRHSSEDSTSQNPQSPSPLPTVPAIAASFNGDTPPFPTPKFSTSSSTV